MFQPYPGHQNYFSNDYDVWDTRVSGSNQLWYSIAEGIRRSLYLRGGVQSRHAIVDGEAQWVAVANLVTSDDLLELCRYYTVLKGQSSYRRCIAWVVTAPPRLA